MEWYWWVLIAVGVIALFGLVRGRSQPPRTNELLDIVQRSREAKARLARDEHEHADQELAKLVATIADLYVAPPNPAYPKVLSRDQLPGYVKSFMRDAGLEGMRTSTQMLHVVMSPVQITALVRSRPTEARAEIRDFIRIAADQWAVRERHADSMAWAIKEAEAESDRVVAMMKRAAEAAPAPAQAATPPQPSATKMRPYPRKNADARDKIEFDLSSAPLWRPQMDLLWIGRTQLQVLKLIANNPSRNIAIDLTDHEPTPAASLFATITQHINAGTLTEAHIDWALMVDAVAEQAESAFKHGDVLEAIELYRDALAEAPGCDVYLMSMGTCFAELGALRDAVRYYERAAEISPKNAQIARNLAGARTALKNG